MSDKILILKKNQETFDENGNWIHDDGMICELYDKKNEIIYWSELKKIKELNQYMSRENGYFIQGDCFAFQISDDLFDSFLEKKCDDPEIFDWLKENHPEVFI